MLVCQSICTGGQIAKVVSLLMHIKHVCLLFSTPPRQNWGIYSPLHLSGIGEYRKGSGPSVCLALHQYICLSIHTHSTMMDFLHFEYHEYIPWDVDAGKIEFGSVLNLSNSCYFFHKCLVLWHRREECGDFCSYLVQISGTMCCSCK